MAPHSQIEPARWELAQFNQARAIAPLDSPALAGFIAQLERINHLADAAPGFVWRFKGARDDVPAAPAAGDPQLLLNLSVWRSIEDLYAYVYRSDHGRQMSLRRQWFEQTRSPQQVLWWIPLGERPTLDEGIRRLQLLREHGPSPDSFTFKRRFAPPALTP